MLQATLLAGAFRRDADRAGQWTCAICSTINGDATDDTTERCRTCQRLRSPQWLDLEDSDVQIALGSKVSHTSPGGSKTVSVVVAINYIQKVVTLLRLKAKHNEGSAHDDVSFHEVALNASQLQQQLEPLDAEEEDYCLLDDYGICGECRGVFRVAQGDKQSQYANEDKIAVLHKELQQLGELKQKFAREKAYERALECATEIKMKTMELLVAKRELEFHTPVFCPFCGWSC
ncbi:hypothetical protein PF005_g1638 [Phytophthora fragariae]|uniref:RanBP2-type domain-containing protein n=1 Tax=Phytophthora fragariae TaxID=53985 RepID=A0A6A3FWF1_9STRA|nr:hypothetical protein PF003_g5368 [Phytophthora fragariae]KAE8948781.1 hypothetical protein PF009_g1661 [Phytophthora fragariae]KAE9029621.1 hypothetical protein PF011_g989 [Phytophthora fragariae]KAE9128990.1 hypothetical protein PF010_g4310 [Phytophthora fragariae]KAE9137424.1 hypothetical protein PF007_g1794 [Phytophthora fragariae]